MVSSKEINEMLKAKREGRLPKTDENHKNEIKKCPECGTENKEDAKFCIGCGMGFEKKAEIKDEDITEKSETKICPSCKSEIPENAKFCVVCGETQTETIDEPVREEIAPQQELEGIKLTVQELVLDPEGLKFKKILDTEGLDKETDLIRYGDIEDIKSKADEVTIDTAAGSIKIKGVDPDRGSEFASYAREMVEKAKPQIDAESMDKIQKAVELLDAGAISQDEFEKIKRKILEKD